MKHISYISSGIVYATSTALCVGILYSMWLGWQSMPPEAHSLFGLIIFYALACCMICLFCMLLIMFGMKLHAQWIIDRRGIKEVKKPTSRKVANRD